MSDLIKGLLTDYVNNLAKDHPTAARLVQAYANNEVARSLESDASAEPVDADHSDR